MGVAAWNDIWSWIKWISMQINGSSYSFTNLQKQNSKVIFKWIENSVSFSVIFPLGLWPLYLVQTHVCLIPWWTKEFFITFYILCITLPTCKHGTLLRNAAEWKCNWRSIKIYNHNCDMISTKYITVRRSLFYFIQQHFYGIWSLATL